MAGETKFNETYNENILVNAMAVGHAKEKSLLKSKRFKQSCCLRRIKDWARWYS